MQKKLNIRDASAGILTGFLFFWVLDRFFGLTEGAFHHIFGTGILFSYLLAPLAISFVVGYIAGPYGKFLGLVPTMGYLLTAYLLEIMHPSGLTVGIPVAPFMMIFFITVPEVSLLGGYVGEILRRRQGLKKVPKDRPKTRGPQRVS